MIYGKLLLESHWVAYYSSLGEQPFAKGGSYRYFIPLSSDGYCQKTYWQDLESLWNPFKYLQSVVKMDHIHYLLWCAESAHGI